MNVLPNTISQGVIGQLLDGDIDAPLQLSIAINPGNSGGPAIDSSGRVVGAVTAKFKKIEGVALCVPSDRIYEELLKFYKD
jgi:S1-C subfamily serine protease